MYVIINGHKTNIQEASVKKEKKKTCKPHHIRKAGQIYDT